MNRGATRMVLIRSGGYDYAELELGKPVHLVAANNAGKTTLINALQFLYIDDFGDMHFPHDARATKEHYFPHEGSMVLFECLTPTGLQVLAFRGLGPVRGYDYERLIYSGAFERTDFVDGSRVRPWSEVTHRLVAREVRTQLTAGNVRAALTATGDTKGPPLGLVPLKRSDNYGNFRFLFRNLVTLSRIDQEKLKSLFVDISLHRLSSSRVDLRSDYTESYRRITDGMNMIAALKRIEGTTRRLSEQCERREALRAMLASTWQVLESTFAQHRANDEERKLQFLRQRRVLEQELRELEARLAELGARGAGLNAERGRLEGEVATLEALRDRVKDVVPHFEEATRERLVHDRDALIARLRDVKRARASDVEGKIKECERAIASNTRLLERHADAIATWLRANSGLPPEALDQVFRILHPHLLSGVVGNGAGDVVIEDSDRLVGVLRQVHELFTSDGFAGAGVRVPFGALSSDAPLAAYADVDAVEQRLKDDRTRLSELQQLHRDVQARQQLERERAELDGFLTTVEARLRAWRDWEASKATLSENTARLASLGGELDEVARATDTLREEQDELKTGLRDLEQYAADAQEAYERALGEKQRLTPPQLDWPQSQGTPSEPHELAALIDAYRRTWYEQTDTARKVEQLFGTVETETGTRYIGASESETLATLRSEIEALPERVEGVKSQWASLVASMRNAFKGLVAGVDEIQRQVTALNRTLKARRISNLAQVELMLSTQEGLLKQLRGVLSDEDAPLFSEDEQRSKATREVAEWLEDRPVMELLELFDLRFRVIDSQGRVRTFTSLSQIESQGTSTTIKVLVHLELMKSLLSSEGVSIPFVLDEVSALDDANLRNLITHATTMGFVPVVASPQVTDAVDTIYCLPQGAGRPTLNQANRLIIERAAHATA